MLTAQASLIRTHVLHQAGRRRLARPSHLTYLLSRSLKYLANSSSLVPTRTPRLTVSNSATRRCLSTLPPLDSVKLDSRLDRDARVYYPPSPPGTGSASECHLAVLPDSFVDTPLYDYILSRNLPPISPTPSTPSSSSRSTLNPLYEIKLTSIPHKGLGVFTNQATMPGTIITSETPALLAALTRLDEERQASLTNLPVELASLCVRYLSDGLRRDIRSLSRGFRVNEASNEARTPREERESEEGEIERVIQMNSIRVDADEDSFAVLGLTSSRCNHSCSPNAFPSFSSPTNTLSLISSTHIPSSTELTISYIDVLLPRSERTRFLRDTWGFECDCPSCSSSSSFTSASDERRKELREWFLIPTNKIAATLPFKPTPTHPEPLTRAILKDSILSPTLRYIELSDKEGFLHSSYTYHALERIALCYALLGEKELFLEWAARARDCRRVEDVSGGRKGVFTVVKWEEALRDPKGSIARWGEYGL